MQGLAQGLFFEREKKGGGFSERWPFLKKLLKERRLAPIDFALTEFLLKPFPDSCEELAAFLCYLSLAVREGHLCVKVAHDLLSPDPLTLWRRSKEHEVIGSETHLNDEGILRKLKKMIQEGSKQIPLSLFSDVTNILEPPKSALYYDAGRFYFQRIWMLERRCHYLFDMLMIQKPTVEIDRELIRKGVEELIQKGDLISEQGDSIAKASEQGLTLLCGGPGTGKTYTIAHLIRLFLKGMKEDVRSSFEIALAAPTGKAAIHLEYSLNKHLPDLSLKATTLHSLLKSSDSQIKRESSFLSADLVIVDESSMIDLKMMVNLLISLKPGSQLILVGDPHQLTPVESGSLFADFVSSAKRFSNAHTPIELQHCHRIESKAIVQLSHAIIKGDVAGVLSIFKEKSHPEIAYKFIENVGAIQKELIDALLSRFSPSLQNFEQLFAHFNRFRLLAALRKGPLGVDVLNQLCAAAFQRKSGQMVAPIMITKNDRRLALFNGENGMLVRDDGEEYALFPALNDRSQLRRISAPLLPSYEYAFCLSIYKSQGSEFDEIWVVLPEGSELFGRELLYTAITRGRHSLKVWGSEVVITETIKRRGRRESSFSD